VVLLWGSLAHVAQAYETLSRATKETGPQHIGEVREYSYSLGVPIVAPSDIQSIANCPPIALQARLECFTVVVQGRFERRCEMSDFVQLLSFGAGAFCLGCAFIISVLFSLSARNTEDRSEGCLGKFFASIGLLLAAFFFYLAITA
jgi:hypothetical protein